LAAEYGLSPMPDKQMSREVVGYRDSGVPSINGINAADYAEKILGRNGANPAMTASMRAAMDRQSTNNVPIYADEREGYGASTAQNAAPQRGIPEMAVNSPLYQAIMGGRDAGEQAIARSSNATGGLRGGQSVSDLATFNRDLSNRALIESRNSIIQGLGSFAGMPSMAPQIAGQYNNIGGTMAQGQIAAGQAQQQGIAGAANAIGSGINAYYGSKV